VVEKPLGKRRYSLLRKMEEVGDLKMAFRQIGYEKIS
jgi:molybdenum-dependent DNA-binding transcriptional regulator ModE